jgi:hypothetical protein
MGSRGPVTAGRNHLPEELARTVAAGENPFYRGLHPGIDKDVTAWIQFNQTPDQIGVWNQSDKNKNAVRRNGPGFRSI